MVQLLVAGLLFIRNAAAAVNTQQMSVVRHKACIPGNEIFWDLPSGCASWQNLDVQPVRGLLLHNHSQLLKGRAILLQLGP
jgi:hypothetical protein